MTLTQDQHSTAHFGFSLPSHLSLKLMIIGLICLFLFSSLQTASSTGFAQHTPEAIISATFFTDGTELHLEYEPFAQSWLTSDSTHLPSPFSASYPSIFSLHYHWFKPLPQAPPAFIG